MSSKTIIERLSVAYLVGLVLLMVIPIGNGSGVDAKMNNIFIVGYRGDYILHCMVYLPWMFVGRILYRSKLHAVLWCVIGLIAVSALEYIQMLLPYRGFNINDLVAGIIGVLFSCVVMFSSLKIQRRLGTNWL